jgi:serine/threonine protein kinase
MPNIIGRIIQEQFRVEEFIASGGMSAVYRVWDIKRNVPLAMKVLHADFMDDPTAFKSFQREARALQRLRHPNIVPFYGLYQTEDFAFILQHFIDGPSLRDILRKSPRGLPAEQALTYVRALCSAFGYAHDNGVVHCDIKPANVMIDRGGQVYLADFGIARHSESATTTLAGAGTPAYMAPEQIRGEQVSPATDIYSAGVLLFELLTGQRPFRGDEPELLHTGSTTGERMRYAHLHVQPPDPRQINHVIPSELATIVLRCMAKNPAERYSSTAQLQTAINQVGIHIAERVDVRTLPGVFETSENPYNGRNTPVSKQKKPSVKMIPLAVMAGALLCFIVLGAGLITVVLRPTPEPLSPVNPPVSTELSSVTVVTTLPATQNEPDEPFSSSLAEFRDDCRLYLNGEVILDLSGCFSGGEVAYSPSGQHFLLVVYGFEGDNDGYVFTADGANFRPLTEAGDYLNYTQYEWTPDGRYIVYHSIFSCCVDTPPGVLASKTVRYDVMTGAKDIIGAPNARPEDYKVVRVRSDDVLNIRKAPGTEHPVVGTIPPDGRGIKILDNGPGISADNATWLPVLYQGVVGWVNSHYLTEENSASAQPSAGGDTQIAEKDGAVLVYIPAGDFLMGSTDADIARMMSLCPNCNVDTVQDQKPQRNVYLDAFWMDQTEVTNRQFEQFVRETGYKTTAETINEPSYSYCFRDDDKRL